MNYFNLILLIIPLGYLYTYAYFDKYFYEYLFYNSLLFISLFFYLKLFKINKITNIFIGLILLVFICGYIVKFYLLIYYIDNDKMLYLLTLRLVTKFFNQDIMFLTFEIFTIVFIISTILFTYLYSKKYNFLFQLREIKFKSNKVKEIIFYYILVSSFIIMLLKNYLPGESSLRILFNVLDTFLMPLFYVFLLYISIQSNYRNYKNRVIIVFLLYSIIQYLFFASKVSIVFPLLIFTFLYIDYKSKFIKFKYIVIGFFTVVILYPLLNIYRVVSTFNEDASFKDMFILIASSFDKVSDSINPLLISILSIIGRFTGSDSLSVLISARNTNQYENFNLWYSLVSDKSITQILTYDILKFDFLMGVETSILGQFYFISGSIYLLLFFYISFVLLNYFFILYIYKINTVILRAYYYYYLVMFFLIFNGGIIMKTFLFFVLGFLLMILLLNIFTKIKRRKN